MQSQARINSMIFSRLKRFAKLCKTTQNAILELEIGCSIH
jgi:hypothetical protein